MGWRLTYRHPQPVPVQLDGIAPQQLAAPSLAEIERLPVKQGFALATDNEQDVEIYSGDLLEGGRGEVWLTAGGTG